MDKSYNQSDVYIIDLDSLLFDIRNGFHCLIEYIVGHYLKKNYIEALTSITETSSHPSSFYLSSTSRTTSKIEIAYLNHITKLWESFNAVTTRKDSGDVKITRSTILQPSVESIDDRLCNDQKFDLFNLKPYKYRGTFPHPSSVSLLSLIKPSIGSVECMCFLRSFASTLLLITQFPFVATQLLKLYDDLLPLNLCHILTLEQLIEQINQKTWDPLSNELCCFTGSEFLTQQLQLQGCTKFAFSVDDHEKKTPWITSMNKIDWSLLNCEKPPIFEKFYKVNPFLDRSPPSYWENCVYFSNPTYIYGKVVVGFGRGSTLLGLPTANIECNPPLSIDFIPGILFGWGIVHDLPNKQDQNKNKVVMSLGYNPFFNNTQLTIEPYFFHSFESLFVGKNVSLCVVGMIRVEADYPEFGDLIQAIQNDCDTAKKLLDKSELQKWKDADWPTSLQYQNNSH